MIIKKRVLFNILLMIVVGAIIFAVFIYCNKTIQADKLYPDNYQFVSCFINKRLFSLGTDTAIMLDNSEVKEILRKFQVKRSSTNRDVSAATTYILFDLKVSSRPDKWPVLYVFDDGRIWVDKDNGKKTLSYRLQGDQKDALYVELMEMISKYSQ